MSETVTDKEKIRSAVCGLDLKKQTSRLFKTFGGKIEHGIDIK